MKRPNPLLAWHASPFDLPEGKFGPMEETSGRGQGAATYGRGAAYVAENPKVSGPGESEYMREFQNHPSARGRAARWSHNGEVLEDQSRDVPGTTIRHIYAAETPQEFVRRWLTAYPKANIFPRGGGISGILRDLQNIVDEDAHSGVSGQKVKDALKWLKNRKNAAQFKRVDEPAGPYSYKVAVHLGDDTLLDWDTPLEDHHPEMLKKITDLEYPEDMGGGRIFNTTVHKSSGQQAYQTLTANLNSDFAASKALYNAGIHGIRYKDAGSRKALDTYIDGVKIEKDWKHPSLPREVAQAIRYAAEQTDIHTDLLTALRKRHDDIYHATRQSPDDYRFAIEWVKDGQVKVETRPSKPTYNYVVFHPDLLETLEQYNIKGEKTKDYGPGVHLKAVEHDPFEGEDR